MKKAATNTKAAADGGGKEAGAPIGTPGNAAGMAAPEPGAASGPEAGAIQISHQVEPVPADDRLLRVMADFDNYRKRALREKTEVHRQAREELMLALLSVLDHLDLALAAAEEHDAQGPVMEGFRLVADELLRALRKHGLKPLDAAGAPFDPHRHEAIAYTPSADVAPDHVVQQTRKGYMLGDRLLRPAQVVVASGAKRPPPAAPEDGAEV